MLRYYDKISPRPSNDVNEVWFDTGDIGSIDDNGNLWLVGRSNGRIKSGGENIYPEEVSSFFSYLDDVIRELLNISQYPITRHFGF